MDSFTTSKKNRRLLRQKVCQRIKQTHSSFQNIGILIHLFTVIQVAETRLEIGFDI